ncbi:MAG: hypothetical protein ACTSPI_04675 [Candidatus Heimdallarchaeaceae archaeon]
MYNIVTKKRINPYAFIINALERYGVIDELYIATYRISYKSLLNFKHMIEEQMIEEMYLLVNNAFETLMRDKAKVIIDMDKQLNEFHLISRHSHAKVTLIRCKNKHIVIQGSGNYSENPKIEQYTIIEDKNVFDFHKEWIING